MGRGTGRGTESSGTAGACDLPRFTARGKGKAGARAPARQRSVTSPRRTGPHVGLFGSRQAPPLQRPRPPLKWRLAGGARFWEACSLFSGLPPGFISALSPNFGAARPQPRPSVSFATRPEPRSCCGRSATQSHIAGRWSRCLLSPHGARL